jgi:PAS domain S-box-containing protein
VTYYDLIEGLSRNDIDAVIGDAHFAHIDPQTIPILCLAGDPPRLIFANQAALTFFAAADLASLADVLFKSPSAVRLLEHARSMRCGLPPRVERLRFYQGAHAEYASYQFRRSLGTHPILIMSVVGVRIGGVEEVVAESTDLDADAQNAVQTGSSPSPVDALMSIADVHSFDDVRLYYKRSFADAPSVRFLWQTNADGQLTSITGQLCEAVGCTLTDLVGKDMRHALDELGVGAQALTQAMSRADTFSGIELLWPVAHLDYAVPVSLGAIPAFDRARQFEGFRGYGIVYLNDVQMRVEPQFGQAEVEQEDRVIDDHVEQDHVEQDLGANVVPLRLWQERAAAQQAAEDKSAPPPPESESIAPDQPDSSAAPEQPSHTSKPSVQHEHGDHLTPAERLAFREIARALGARTRQPTENETSPPPPASTPQRSHDIVKAEREQDMQALAANAHQLVDRLPIGILVTRAEIPLFLNRTFLDLLGFDDADAFHDAGGLDHLFGAGGVNTSSDDGGAIQITGKDGAPIALECRVLRIMWDNQPATLMSFRRAIEPEAQALMHVLEAELSRTEAETRELHAILDTATDGVAVLDHRGRILSLNRAGEALFGYEQTDVAGQSITCLLAPESHATALDYLAGLQSNGVASLLNDGREVIGRAQKGGTLPVFMTLGRLQAGGETKFCAVLRDMTPWKRAESELRDARREAERVSALKSDFLAKMSHEIRTPLNAILGFAEVIMEERFGPIGNERYKDYLKDIHASGAHVMSLINDLLDLSKIEAGKLELNFTSVDANRIVGECVHLMQPQASRERVIMRQSLAPHLPQIVADERALRQIVLNLLSNAIKFNEAGGQVIISTAFTDAGHAVIRIRDTGIGMSESDVQTALEPFRQLATTRQTAGTGLGLPLTKALVEANRASFVIRSQKNNGTLVEVTFPPTRVLAE